MLEGQVNDPLSWGSLINTFLFCSSQQLPNLSQFELTRRPSRALYLGTRTRCLRNHRYLSTLSGMMKRSQEKVQNNWPKPLLCVSWKHSYFHWSKNWSSQAPLTPLCAPIVVYASVYTSNNVKKHADLYQWSPTVSCKNKNKLTKLYNVCFIWLRMSLVKKVHYEPDVSNTIGWGIGIG